MGWDEVKKLHNRFTKYPLDLLYYIADYKMHGKESYAYKIERIRNMIYNAVDISMFDDDLIIDTFVEHLIKGRVGKAIAARYDLPDKNTYIEARQLHELYRTPLITNKPTWFKKILMDNYFIRLCFSSGMAHEIAYILVKCGIPADHIFKATNRDSEYITSGMTNSLGFNKNMFTIRDWDGRIFNLDMPGLDIRNAGNMDPFELAGRIDILRPSIIAINGIYIDPNVNDYYLDIVTPTSQYTIFNLSGVPMSNTNAVMDILRKKIDSFKNMQYVYGREGYFAPCSIYIIGDMGTALIGGNGIKLIGRLYAYN